MPNVAKHPINEHELRKENICALIKAAMVAAKTA